MGHPRRPPRPLTPLGVTVKEAAAISSVSEAKVWEWLAEGRLASALVDGRRIVNYESLKNLIAPDKAKKVRKGLWNPTGAQPEQPRSVARKQRERRAARKDPRQLALPGIDAKGLLVRY